MGIEDQIERDFSAALRHCERSEAIQKDKFILWIASSFLLAMTPSDDKILHCFEGFVRKTTDEVEI